MAASLARVTVIAAGVLGSWPGTATAAIPMQLPFPVGETWQANGPHANPAGTVRKSVDFGRTNGTTGTVVAVAAGTVSHVGNCGGGTEVRIDHADGWQSGYFHLGSASVGVGQAVSMGQAIGTTGLGCDANGFNHVHLSIRRNGSDINIDGLDIGGHTLHAKAYNYGGYWTRNSDGARMAEDVGGDARCCLTSLAVAPPGDGAFVRTPNGNIYRIVGGAPIHLHSCGSLGGCAGYVSLPDLNAYRAVPRDGAFVRKVDGPGAGTIARVAGGHLIGLGSCAPAGVDGCPGTVEIDGGGWAAYAGAHPQIAAGTIVRKADGPGASTIARVAGGHLIGLGTCAPAGIDGCPGAVNVDHTGWTNYAGAHPHIADGAFVRKADGPGAGTIARVAGGHLIGLGTCAPVGIDGCPGTVNVDHLGWTNYANAHPRVFDGAFVRIANGTRSGHIARAAGGSLLGLTDCGPLSGCAGYVNVDEHGFDGYHAQHPRPADGTLLRGMPSLALWRIDAGLRYPAAAGSGAIAVNDATIASLPEPSPGDGAAGAGAGGGADTTAPQPGAESALPGVAGPQRPGVVARRRASKLRLRRGLRVQVSDLLPGSVVRVRLSHGKKVVARSRARAGGSGAVSATLKLSARALAKLASGARLTITAAGRAPDGTPASARRRLRVT